MGRRTKVAGIATALAVGLTGVAEAKTETYRGSFQQDNPGSSIAFNVKVSDKKPKMIFQFAYGGAQGECDFFTEPGQTYPFGGNFQDTKVKKKGGKYSFSKTNDSGSDTAEIRGTFSRNLKEIEGELDYSRIVNAEGNECFANNLKFSMVRD